MVKAELIKWIKDAIALRGSDIHFNLTDKKEVLISLRTGHVMIPRAHIERDIYEKMLAYIRFHASMDLSNPLKPQSGALIIENEGDVLHCRVSILPTAKFQSMVLRIINSKMGKQLDEIPMFTHNVDILKRLAKTEAGMILIGGPTSSGKTTTAYAMIDYLKNELGKTVITIEDPIEYQQPDIVQMQVNESAGMNYEVGIKEILRHDPDVIVIGEIRDETTAANAVRAALTGHLVVSTVHSKDNIGTLFRLMDLGISPTDLSQSLIGLINQRLMTLASDKKAVFEISTQKALEKMLSQLQIGVPVTIEYTTVDEEMRMWETIKN